MSSGGILAEPPRPFPLHDWTLTNQSPMTSYPHRLRIDSPSPLEQFATFKRSSNDLPAPIEPRPTSQPISTNLPRPLEPKSTHQFEATFNEPSRFHRSQESFRASNTPHAEYRSQTQNLPRLRDIVTQSPRSSGDKTGHRESWTPAPGPTFLPYQSQSQVAQPQLHPPLVYPGPQNSGAPPAPQPANTPPVQSEAWKCAPGLASLSQLVNGREQYTQPHFHPPLAYPPPQDASLSQPWPQKGRPEPSVVNPQWQSPASLASSPYAAQQDSYSDHLSQRRDQGPHPPMAYRQENIQPQYVSGGSPAVHHHRSPTTPLDRSSSQAAAAHISETSANTFLRTEHVPGKGAEYVYRNGARLPTHDVDGERVNPAWGMTKANKARKRLAQACIECREKKIKCEQGPGDVCVNCSKYKRKCQKSASHKSPNEPVYATAWPVTRDSPNGSSPNIHIGSRMHDTVTDASGKHRPRDDVSSAEFPSKRQRSDSPNYDSVAVLGGRPEDVHGCGPTSASKAFDTRFKWDVDPFLVDPDATMQLLEDFIKNVNNSTLGLFPPEYLKYWVRTSPQKCPLERLVLYAVLAAGSIFAEGALCELGKQFADIVCQALKTQIGDLNMAVAQSRLLLGMYNLAKGTEKTAQDYIGSAINAIKFLGYNTEEGCAADAGQELSTFRFDKEQLVECRRRTTWTAFLLDRALAGSLCLLSHEDVFVRLPCSDSRYEQGRQDSDGAFLHTGCSGEKGGAKHLNPSAAMLSISAIWGEINAFVFRGLHQSRALYEQGYRRSVEDFRARMQDWVTKLPESLVSSPANLQRSLQGGYAGQYLSLHALHHLALTKLHRYYRYRWIDGLRQTHVPWAHDNAKLLLKLVAPLLDDGSPDRQTFTNTLHRVSPIVSYAIYFAIDVVGAGGLEETIKSSYDLIDGGVQCLANMATHWHSAKARYDQCRRRLLEIRNIHRRPTNAKAGCWVVDMWGCEAAMLREYPDEYDSIFGLGYDVEFFQILRAASACKTKPSGDADRRSA